MAPAQTMREHHRSHTACVYVTFNVSEASSYLLPILTLPLCIPNPTYFSMPLRKWHIPAVQGRTWGSPLTPLLPPNHPNPMQTCSSSWPSLWCRRVEAFTMCAMGYHWIVCRSKMTWWDMNFSRVTQNAMLGTQWTGVKMGAKVTGRKLLQSSGL